MVLVVDLDVGGVLPADGDFRHETSSRWARQASGPLAGRRPVSSAGWSSHHGGAPGGRAAPVEARAGTRESWAGAPACGPGGAASWPTGLAVRGGGERPLVCAVEDEQWLDRASAQACGSRPHGSQADRVGLVIAARVLGEDADHR